MGSLSAMGQKYHVGPGANAAHIDSDPSRWGRVSVLPNIRVFRSALRLRRVLKISRNIKFFASEQGSVGSLLSFRGHVSTIRHVRRDALQLLKL